MRTIGANDLDRALVAAGIPEKLIVLMDEEYYLPPADWITGALAKSLNNFLFDTGIKYVPDRFDCNHFSKTACAIADWCWQQTKGAPEAALAVGLFAFLSQGHCIVVSGDEDKAGNITIGFYEPQPSVPEGEQTFALVCLTPVKLMPEDTASCACCLFC